MTNYTIARLPVKTGCEYLTIDLILDYFCALLFSLIDCQNYIRHSAEKYNISVEVYENGDNVEICNGVLFSHSEDDVVSIKSDKVEVKKENQIIVCSYKDIRYEVQYKDYLSKEIPLN